jgi:putrescine transport system substrate-binding protein
MSKVLWLLGLLLCSVGARADDKQLNLYNWADYIGQNTIAEFERETGIKVVYDTYDADTELEAKVMAGASGYDLVTTSNDYFGRQIPAGVYQILDKSRLPGLAALDPHVVAAEADFDPGNAHTVAYLRGVNGFTYNVGMIKSRMPDAPVDSLDMIFKPEIVRRFADCGVTFLDSADDVIPLALNYLHLDPNTTRQEDFKAAEKLLLAVRPYIRAYDSVEYMNELPNNEICIAMSWSADYETVKARADAAGLKPDVAFTIPKEGANEWFDAWLMPKGAPHPDAAYKFLNYLLRPEVIAEVTNHIHYGNDNRAADRFVAPELRADPAIYPPPEVEQRLYLNHVTSARTERMRTRTWTRVKTGI